MAVPCGASFKWNGFLNGFRRVPKASHIRRAKWEFDVSLKRNLRNVATWKVGS